MCYYWDNKYLLYKYLLIIHRISTQVLSGGTLPKRLTLKQLAKQAEKDLIHVELNKIYGETLSCPILGQHYKIPERTAKPGSIQFDPSFPYVSFIQENNYSSSICKCMLYSYNEVRIGSVHCNNLTFCRISSKCSVCYIQTISPLDLSKILLLQCS